MVPTHNIHNMVPTHNRTLYTRRVSPFVVLVTREFIDLTIETSHIIFS